MVERGGGPIRVLLPCSGLGIVQRGFETFAIECHAALRSHPGVRPLLLRARGPVGEEERRAPTLSRDATPARLLGRVLRRDGYFAEQLVHALTAVPTLLRERPDVVLFSDWALGHALARIRSATRSSYRLLLCNGAPGHPPYPPEFDHVQQLTPALHALALAAGEAPERQTLLPLGVALEAEPRLPAREERDALRERLGLPRDDELVLSVAALNTWHKRLDYVVREVASLDPRPHLVLLGQHEKETPALLALAAAELGTDGFTVRTVAPEAVDDYYRCADAFVLGSVYEGSGRVLLEALGRGLPTVCHDSETTRFVTGPHGLRADLKRTGALAGVLAGLRRNGFSEERRRAQHRFAYDTFGWKALTPRYVDMIARCAAA
jgi:1,2-diacylglycerol 3-alpha-glucosyltransferase